MLRQNRLRAAGACDLGLDSLPRLTAELKQGARLQDGDSSISRGFSFIGEVSPLSFLAAPVGVSNTCGQIPSAVKHDDADGKQRENGEEIQALQPIRYESANPVCRPREDPAASSTTGSSPSRPA